MRQQPSKTLFRLPNMVDHCKLCFTIFICLILLYNYLEAQNPPAPAIYHNEWIDYDQTYYKIKVENPRFYRIQYSTLEQMDLPAQTDGYKVYHRGREIPIYVSTDGDLVNDNDYIEFYGQPNDGEFDTQLYEQASWQIQPKSSLFSENATYYLTWDDETPSLRFQRASNSLDNPPVKEAFFLHEVTKILDETQIEGIPFRIGGGNQYFSEFDEGEGFVSTEIKAGQQRTITLKTPSIYYEGNQDALVKINLISTSNNFSIFNDHHVRISLNEQVFWDETFEGYQIKNGSFSAPVSTLTGINNNVTIHAVDDITGTDENGNTISAVNRQHIAEISITYPHSFDFNNANNKLFAIDNFQDKYIEITNFNAGNAPRMYDLSNNLVFFPETKTENGTTIFLFHIKKVTNGTSERELFFSNTSQINPPNQTVVLVSESELESIQFTDYGMVANQGDYLIISHPHLMQGDVNEVERYRDYRKSSQGGGYQAVVVNVQELYDQFAWGIETHPLAIRNFLRFALNTWPNSPKFLLLLGKSINYRQTRNNPFAFEECLVPSFGSNPSDVVLSTQQLGNFTPQLATGRVPAREFSDVRAYLNKVIEYEDLQNNPSCERDERLWLKDALHIAGGNNLNEANAFIGVLQDYEQVYEGHNYGGNVLRTFNKLTESPVEEVNLGDLINNGLNIINFVGHSAGSYWGIDIGEPSLYTNKGKYPFIVTSSCYVGNIHGHESEEDISMSEDYVLAEQLGAIGFLATADLGYPKYLDNYMENFYQNFCIDLYNQPVGKCISEGIRRLEQTYGQLPPTSENYRGNRLTTQQYTYAGDPAIILNSWQNAEFIIENNEQYSDVFIEPSVVTADLDSFTVNVTVTNAGRAVTDSMLIQIERTLPNGDMQIALSQKVLAPAYIDTFALRLPLGNITEVAGQNNIQVSINADNQIQEDCLSNNRVYKEMFVFSKLLIPIEPCQYAIVNDPAITLSAATDEPNLFTADYIFQLDTSDQFTNPIAQNIQNSQTGLVQWQPNITLVDGTVYYWRTAREVPLGEQRNWQKSSFIYLKEGEKGWNQSHYDQFVQDRLNAIELDSINKNFKYKTLENTFSVATSSNISEINIFVNNELLANNSCLSSNCSGGVGVMVFAPDLQLNLTAWESVRETGLACDGRGTYGNVHCSSETKTILEYQTSDSEQLTAFIDLLENSIPDGYFVLVYSIGNHQIGTETNNPDLNNAYQFFNNMGAPQVAQLSNNEQFIVFGQKGKPNFPAQIKIEQNPTLATTFDFSINSTASTGSIFSPPIGPAKSWNQVTWQYENIGITDEIMLNVYGITSNGNEILLLNQAFSESVDISNINANDHPFIRLEAKIKDEAAQSVPQLKYWRVHFERLPELVFDITKNFTLNKDSLQEGEALEIGVNIANVGEVMINDFLVNYYVINENNIRSLIKSNSVNSLVSNGNTSIIFSLNTEGLSGQNVLEIILNPMENVQQLNEKFRFNNTLRIPFQVVNDKINPFVDVTFDGRHILDGEIVSALPTVLIRVQDNNKFLALNDTSDFELFLISPNSSGTPSVEEEVNFNNPMLQFRPPSVNATNEGQNVAEIEWQPDFTAQDGIYELIVRAKDRSGNMFANNVYRTRFQVINEASISQIFNYPNPFTAATRFVFTLTGSEIPQQFKIQIMTISGKVVREITQTELGALHIGHNVTEFAWDGTDQYGNELGNGVYLYRIVTDLASGNSLSDFDTGADISGFFKNGIGKMYLLR